MSATAVILLTTCETAWYIILVVSVYMSEGMYVCLSFESLDVRSSYLHMRYLHGLRVEFVYEGHRVKVKVTGAKKVENSYCRNVNL